MTNAEYQRHMTKLTAGVEVDLRRALDEARTKQFGLVLRTFVAPVWAIVLSLVQPLARVAVKAVIAYVSRMTLAEVGDLLVRYRTESSKGDDALPIGRDN